MKKYTVAIFIIVVLLIGISTIYKNMNIRNEQNNEEQKIIQHESGLIIETVKTGDGKIAEKGRTVSVHYTGKLENGDIFDSSINRGIPFDFLLGSGMVIPGWEIGVEGMREGEKRVLKIPSDLAYGQNGVVSAGVVVIPGNATLIFEVELIEVK